MKLQNYLFMGLLVCSIASCKKDEETEETPTPTPTPTITADQTARFTVNMANVTSTQIDGQNDYVLNTGSEQNPTMGGGSYLSYYSQITLNGNDLSLFDSDTKGLRVEVNKSPNQSTLLSDSEFIALFTEGTYNTFGGFNQSIRFAFAYFDEDGRQANTTDALQNSDDQVEILDAIPEVVDGVQTVKVYFRFDARFLSLDGPGAGSNYNVDDAIFVGVFRNE